MLLFAFACLIAKGIFAAQPHKNSTACLDCTTNVCSTIPPPTSPNPAANPLCYQSTPEYTNNDYNNDVGNEVDSTPVCTTCAAYNYSYYVR